MWVPNVYFWASLSDQPALTTAKTHSFSGNNGSGGDTLEVATDELGKLVLNAGAGRKIGKQLRMAPLAECGGTTDVHVCTSTACRGCGFLCIL